MQRARGVREPARSGAGGAAQRGYAADVEGGPRPSGSRYQKALLLLLPIAVVMRIIASHHGPATQQQATPTPVVQLQAQVRAEVMKVEEAMQAMENTAAEVALEFFPPPYVEVEVQKTGPRIYRQPAAASPPPDAPPKPATALPPAAPKPPPVPSGCRTCEIAAHLQFNAPAIKLFREIDDRTHRGIMVSFSSLGMKEFMVNWARQVEKKGLGPVVIGALDEGAYKICTEHGIPAAAFGSLAMKTTSAYFRQDEGTFLAMATLKTELLRGLLQSGWDIMLSDVDVSWLDSPWRWIGTNGVAPVPEAAMMAKADVLVSSDVVEIEADSHHGRWLLDREYNTGILFFRATNASIGLVKLWRERLEIEGAIKGLYINDQAVFNRMTHGHADGRIDLVDLAPHEVPDIDPNAIRGVYKVQSPIMAPHKLWVNMGVFPLTRFCNGHVFFVNRLPERFGFRAAAVHATYQFADEKVYSFGKRHRLRQAQLWHMDEDPYYSEGNFLAIHGDSLMVGVESVYSQDELPVWRGKEYRENAGIELHMRMESRQRLLLRDAFALAHALGRILVLPHMTCFCDRYWWLVHACRMPGAESMPLPIECPLDHIFDMGRWYDENLEFREARFLDNSRTPYNVTSDRARLKVEWEGKVDKDHSAAPEYDDGSAPSVRIKLPAGLSFEKAAVAISKDPGAKARVLEVEARDLPSFCGFEDDAAASKFDMKIARAFQNHVALCAEEDNILPKENWDPVKLPLNCTTGYGPPENIRTTRCKKSHCNCQRKGSRLMLM